MQYAGIIKNDTAAGEGINVTFFVQGCHFHCKGCHNPETWNFLGGKEFTNDTLQELIAAIKANGVERNLSIMGGEPLCPENLFLTSLIIKTIKNEFPNIKIYIWTGYLFEDLLKIHDQKLIYILKNINYLIDGPFIEEQRDITLPMRGSKNQRIIDLSKENINEC